MTKTQYIDSNYISSQLILPLDVSIKIDKNDSVVSFVSVMEGVNVDKILKRSTRGRQSYNPKRMLYTILFGFMEGVTSTRQFETKAKTDLRYLWLLDGQTPSHMAFHNFIHHTVFPNINILFDDINEVLFERLNVDLSTIYIDGSKLEANANKFTFVWKKAVLKYQEKNYAKFKKLLPQIEDYLGQSFDARTKPTADTMSQIYNLLVHQAKVDNVEFVYGKGNRKTPIQKLCDELYTIKTKAYEYQHKIKLCGEHRNSYSKTDSDATFMHMKEDYYMKTGIFKPGYNIQVGVSEELIVGVQLFQERSDQKTWIPFLQTLMDKYKKEIQYPVADAGYGSLENYLFNLNHGLALVQKYAMYDKDKEVKYRKKNRFKSRYFEINETGQPICPAGKEMEFVQEVKGRYNNTYYGTQRYAGVGCQSCPFQSQCTKSKTGIRHIEVNSVLRELESEVKKNLESEEGIQQRVQRSIQAEGAFAQLKNNLQYTRVLRRGLKNVENEAKLICIGMNLKKYHQKRLYRNLN